MHLIQGIHEVELIERLKEGDQIAFEHIFNFYYSGLVIYSQQFAIDLQEAEDIVQGLFVRLWHKHHKIIPSDSLKSYLFTSVRNSCFKHLKHLKVRDKYQKELLELDANHIAYDSDLYIDSDLQDKIKKGIDSLPEKCREVFVLSRIQGMKNDEIADQLGISKRTVETQISKALKVLRVELKDYLGLLVLLGLFK